MEVVLLPAQQFLHVVACIPVAYVPTAQAVHVLGLEAPEDVEKEPAAHRVHGDENESTDRRGKILSNEYASHGPWDMAP
jgi:hypothetical protein